MPVVPDLAVIATPPDSVPGIIAELGHRGAKAAIIITAGFGEGGEHHGKELKQALLEANKPHYMRILGPNCLGVLVPGSGLNASFSHVGAASGQLAFVTQSGAIVTSMLDWARAAASHTGVLAGTDGKVFREAVEKQWLDRIDSFEPELIMISAGFDGHTEDHMAHFNLVEADYRWITEKLRTIARKHCSGRIVSALEGGYTLSALGRSVAVHIDALIS